MKKLYISTVLLLCGASAFSQLLLLPNDSWTYDFSTLPKIGSTNAFTSSPQGSLQFTINSSSWQPGSVLEYQMFENSAAETPLASGTLSAVPPYGGFAAALNGWQDLQGAIRFHMVSGSAIVDTVTLGAIASGPSLSSYDVYSDTFVPVPEPATILLFGVGLVVALMWRGHRKAG